jgi:hypothetical protein
MAQKNDKKCVCMGGVGGGAGGWLGAAAGGWGAGRVASRALAFADGLLLYGDDDADAASTTTATAAATATTTATACVLWRVSCFAHIKLVHRIQLDPVYALLAS